jgi:hypothetical protein
MTIFSTNGINILAGINGIEVAQSVVIAVLIVINDVLYLSPFTAYPHPATDSHLFSLYFLLPFIGVSLALLMPTGIRLKYLWATHTAILQAWSSQSCPSRDILRRHWPCSFFRRPSISYIRAHKSSSSYRAPDIGCHTLMHVQACWSPHE